MQIWKLCLCQKLWNQIHKENYSSIYSTTKILQTTFRKVMFYFILFQVCLNICMMNSKWTIFCEYVWWQDFVITIFLWYGWPTKSVGLISSRHHCQRSSPSRISDTLWAGFESTQNLSSGLVEWSCAIVITTTSKRQGACAVPFIEPLFRGALHIPI